LGKLQAYLYANVKLFAAKGIAEGKVKYVWTHFNLGFGTLY
jgi:hypothetical protein